MGMTEADAMTLLDGLGVHGMRVVADMREWVADCAWVEIEDEDDLAALTEYEIIRGVQRHYSGGVAAFVATCDYLKCQGCGEWLPGVFGGRAHRCDQWRPMVEPRRKIA